jgi:hypothetical protein
VKNVPSAVQDEIAFTYRELRKSSVLVVLLALLAFTNIAAATTYTTANVKGSYSVLMNGYSGAASETAWLGIFNFDGVSAVTGSITIIDSGSLSVITVPSGSTYSVSPNGSGSITLNTSGGSPIAFVLNSVSASIAKSLQLVLIDTSKNDVHVRAGTASLINLSGAATAARLKGTYGILLNWWTTATQQGAVGTIAFDGKSKVTISYTDQQAEQTATTITGSGIYSVNSDGSGSLSLTLSNATTMQLDFVMNSITGTSVAKGLQLLDVTTPSSTSVDTGTAVYE